MKASTLGKEVRELLGGAKLDIAIGKLQNWFEEEFNPLDDIEWRKLRHKVIHISARFNSMKDDFFMNTISRDEVILERSKIIERILELVDQIERLAATSISKTIEVSDYEVFKRFFGLNPPKIKLILVYGIFEASSPLDSQSAIPVIGAKYYYYRKGEKMELKIKTEFHEFIGSGDFRSIINLLPSLSWNQIYFPETIKDYEVQNEVQHSLICIGSPAANQKTEEIMDRSNFAQRVCSFVFLKLDGSQEMKLFDNSIIELDQAEKSVELIHPRKDFTYSIILKMKNKQNDGTFNFVCAGLRGSGTAAAAYYLARNWKNLSKEFENEEFCLFIESKIGSDTSAFCTKKVSLDNTGNLIKLSS